MHVKVFSSGAYLATASLSLLMVMIISLQADHSRYGFADCS